MIATFVVEQFIEVFAIIVGIAVVIGGFLGTGFALENDDIPSGVKVFALVLAIGILAGALFGIAGGYDTPDS